MSDTNHDDADSKDWVVPSNKKKSTKTPHNSIAEVVPFQNEYEVRLQDLENQIKKIDSLEFMVNVLHKRLNSMPGQVFCS